VQVWHVRHVDMLGALLGWWYGKLCSQHAGLLAAEDASASMVVDGVCMKLSGRGRVAGV
jgi:hypothetical protein